MSYDRSSTMYESRASAAADSDSLVTKNALSRVCKRATASLPPSLSLWGRGEPSFCPSRHKEEEGERDLSAHVEFFPYNENQVYVRVKADFKRISPR